MRTRPVRWGATAACAMLAQGCSTDAFAPGGLPLEAPAAAGDGWPVAAPAEAGFDPDVLALMDRRLRTREIEEVDALLIARHGMLVYEGYYVPETGVDRRHQLNSTSKTVTSIVLGAVHHAGLLPSPDTPLADVLPEAADLFDADPRKRDIRLRHALSMTAGLDWDTEDVRERDRDDIRINAAPNAVRYVLEKPMTGPPGQVFFYNSGCSVLLTGLVHALTGAEADAYAAERVFGPLGITDVLWQTTGDGTARGQDGVHMRARDLLKLGQLYLDGGVWRGHRIVDPAWIDASFQRRIDTDWGDAGYGYQWWMQDLELPGRAPVPDGILFGSGYGGQKLVVIPSLDLTAVFFGCTTEGYECGISDVVPELVLWNYVLRALDGSV